MKVCPMKPNNVATMKPVKWAEKSSNSNNLLVIIKKANSINPHEAEMAPCLNVTNEML